MFGINGQEEARRFHDGEILCKKAGHYDSQPLQLGNPNLN